MANTDRKQQPKSKEAKRRYTEPGLFKGKRKSSPKPAGAARTSRAAP